MKHSISLKQARFMALQSQGLLKPSFGKGKKGTLSAVEHLGYVQLDTLSVVARAHHNTLWSRVPDYSEVYLNELLEKDKTVFEYWSHAASYLPMKDYRFSLPLKKAYADGKSHWFNLDEKLKLYVLDRIKTEGPLQSKDFEHKRQSAGNWFDWKPAKKALEQLFMEGKLMVAKRHGFQKVYALTKNVIPAWVETGFPTDDEYAEHLILTAVQAHGLVSEPEIYYLRSRLKTHIKKVLHHLLKEGLLKEVFIEGLEKIPFATTEKNLGLMSGKTKNNVHFLSPFDNTVIQRKRLKQLFGFDYQIECYVPEAKRVYGYFTLPVLYNNSFIGRFDPKAERKTGTFYIKSFHFENNFKPDENFNCLFSEKLKQFAVFNGCQKIIISQADEKWKKDIISIL